MTDEETLRRWEAERRDVKRREIRLSRGLQSLEEARLSYLNSITKEQKRLQQELQRLQKSHSKRRPPVSPEQRNMRLSFPVFSPQDRQNDSYFQETALRKKTLSKGRRLPKASPSSFHSQTFNSDISGSAEDRKEYLPSLKPRDQRMTILNQAITKQLIISAKSEEREEINGKVEQRIGFLQEKPTVKSTTQSMNFPGKRRPSLGREKLNMNAEAYGVDGRLRTIHSRPDFLKSYAEVRKARYIRHKNIPACEKELSLQDIFGLKKTTEYSFLGQNKPMT